MKNRFTVAINLFHTLPYLQTHMYCDSEDALPRMKAFVKVILEEKGGGYAMLVPGVRPSFQYTKRCDGRDWNLQLKDPGAGLPVRRSGKTGRSVFN